MTEPAFTVAQVADLAQCSTKTVMRAIDAGELRASQLAKRGTWRIRREDIDAWFDLRANTQPRPRTVTTPPARPIQVGRARRRRPAHGRVSVTDEMGRMAS